MPRRRRPFVRKDSVRDARLIIVATEDTKATVVYFKALTSPAYYQSSKVHVEILIREDTASGPRRVLDQLDEWCKEYQIGQDDELWLVIDRDRWGDSKLSQIAQECSQKDVLLAVSNPAIELWFLLHLTGLDHYDRERLKEFYRNAKVSSNRTRLEVEILNFMGSYNKSNLNVDQYLPHVEEAIERAEKLDVRKEDRWPQTLGTRVYLLAQSIIDSAT